MELGNLLFGHSRGAYEVDRSGEPCDLLEWLMTGLGLGGDGRLDEDVRRRMGRIGFEPDWLVETDRGLDVHDPRSGVLLLRTRAYWWGDGDDPESALPNLEIPALGFSLDWYKYMFRDSYSNLPLTLGLVNRMYGLLMPVLAEMIPFAPYPVKADCEWTAGNRMMRVGDELQPILLDCRAVSPNVRPEYDHGFIRDNAGDGRHPFFARMMNRNERFIFEEFFDSLDEAKSWCERRMIEWRDPDAD
ncbi:hypothetical protein [Bifidobacterium sp. SO1]|uniref:hypothetical protein n=1 Tax=Bifidobacterium sp. SO1 TaxID=2809029 RepID=UPI001BDD5C3E|nr:hypothetical protein [Bifidobacterium sp. SO1]MBT1162803.1 hypothetical protein [Bifidobacterium sp. SO1]